MRINVFVARSTGLSRRRADLLIIDGKVSVNGETALLGTDVTSGDKVKLDNKELVLPLPRAIALNKPRGYVVSRNGQGAHTIYDLLPPELNSLKAVGRLDKDSSGLLILTNEGNIADKLTHPRFAKIKVYEVSLQRTLTANEARKLEEGVLLEDGVSRLGIKPGSSANSLLVTLSEGRNRQIRRSFQAIGHNVISLHRVSFGPYALNGLEEGKWRDLSI